MIACTKFQSMVRFVFSEWEHITTKTSSKSVQMKIWVTMISFLEPERAPESQQLCGGHYKRRTQLTHTHP